MKRLAWAAIIGVLATTAYLLPEPESASQPDFGSVAAVDVASASGVWFCGTSEATFERDTRIVVASPEATSAQFSFPNPVPGEESEAARLPVGGPGAVELLVSDVALRGDAPAFVELATSKAATFALLSSEAILQGDRCHDAVPKVWYVPGGSTAEGRTLRLRLFNPFPEAAIVNVNVSSELGDEPVPELQGLAVMARSWRDVNFEDILNFRDVLSFTIAGQEGFVLPSLILGEAEEEASWPGTGLSTSWEFPVSRLAGMEPTLSVTNPGEDPLTVTVDLFTPEGPILAARTVTVSGRIPGLISLSDLADGPMGLRVSADGPFAAAVLASGTGGVAGTVGVPRPATRWLLPGAAGDQETVSSLWLMNSTAAPITISVLPLGTGATSAQKLIIEAGSVRQFITEPGTEGYLVDGTDVISAAWTAQSPVAAVFVAGVAID